MAPRYRKPKSKKPKVTKPKPGPTQARTSIADLLEVQTKTTTTNIVASATPDNVEIKVTQTVQEKTAISQLVTPTKKRKVNDLDATDLAEPATPRKKRTLSNESNPAGRTRSQTKLLKKILGQDENSDVDYSILDDTKAVVKSEAQSNDDAPADETITIATNVEEETVEVSVKNEDEEVQVKTRRARKSKGIAVARIAKQSTLDPNLVKQKPHPPSKGDPFRQIKLKYMKGNIFPMPVELVNALEFHERNINENTGVLKVKPDAAFWDNGKLGIKFGVSPFTTRIEPTPAQCLTVWNALDAWLRDREKPVIIEPVGTLGAQTPAHGNASITVDCLVRTVMAQATANDLALTVQSLVNKRFTYTVNGEQVVGKLPNFHAMRAATQAQLEEAIKQGGLFKSKASTIMNALNAVYNKNVEIIKAANGGMLPPNTELGQAPNQPDFVPGLLSMDFMRNMSMAEVFNFIVNIDGIGHKTAACILEFNYGFPICAVDIHVNKMARWLGWVPENFNELQTFRHLEGRIPNHLKHLLHQAFWHHPQLCKRCKLGLAKDDPALDKDGVALPPCPIEHLLTRFKPNPVPRKRAVVAAGEDGEVKKPKAVMPWKAFADADEAAVAGYEAFDIAVDDDFAAGSVNVAVVQKWRFVGF